MLFETNICYEPIWAYMYFPSWAASIRRLGSMPWETGGGLAAAIAVDGSA
jgi:hypothetical protein